MKLSPGLISEATGIERISADAMACIERYCTSLLNANRRINLISRRGDQPIEVTRQFLISIAAISAIPERDRKWWLDIGSGGGFPAIPIAIFRPNIQFVLAESIAKKAYFLERTVEELGLDNVRVINQRVDPGNHDLHPEAGRFDWLSIKAVTDWEESLRWGSWLVKPDGCLLTYKAGKPTAVEMMAINETGFELLHTFDLGDFFNFTVIKVLILKRISTLD